MFYVLTRLGRVIALVAGIQLTAYVVSEPGEQVWQAILGGFLLGLFISINDTIHERELDRRLRRRV